MKMMTSKNKIIKGLGNDIIEIHRIQRSIERHGERFIERIFTPGEILYCKKHALSYRHFAGRFAAKEAIAKALGTGIGKHLSWLDIEILNDSSGKPSVQLSKKRKDLFVSPHILISISHCKTFATAVAIVY